MIIKEKLKNVTQLLKKIFEKFPVTFFVIAIFTIFLAIVIDTKTINEDIFKNIMFFTIYFAPGSFLVETLLNKNSAKKIVAYILAAIISIIFTVLQNIVIATEWIDGFLLKLSICYILTLCVLSIYFLFKRSQKDFKEYVLKIFINIFKTDIIYAILSIGIAIISSIFVYLIWENLGYVLILRLEIILFGIYYVPRLLYCLVDVDDEVHVFFKGLIKYVLTTLIVISFIIIYMYIIKILILRDMPKNQIFRILSALFIIGMPIWTMMQYFKDENIWYKVSTKLPIAFIPFIILQIYTIGIRIINNGFTPLRYMCIALIILETAYVLTYIIKKEKLEILLLFFNVLVIIALIVPGINMFKISNISQAQNLKIFKQKSNYTNEEKEKIYGAYEYLKLSEDGEKYINEILDDEDINEIKAFKKSKVNTKYLNTQYIQANFHEEKTNIDGYSKLYILSTYNRSIEKSIEDAFLDIKLDCQYSSYSTYANLSEEFKNYINTYMDYGKDELQKYFKENHEIEIDSNRKIIISSFYLNYDEDLKLVKNYSIKGYLLEK